MTFNILNSKSAAVDGEDLRSIDHLRVTSAIAESKQIKPSTHSIRMKIEKWLGFEHELKWLNIMGIFFLHMGTLYTLFTVNIFENVATFSWTACLTILQAMGTTAGVHRLWTHNAYKAKLPLRILLLIFFTSCGQNKISSWVKDHRVHHKYTDTEADPHNISRGFFFAHVGWLMMKKHPEVIRKGRQIDMSDVLADPVVAFGEKYFILCVALFSFAIPIMVPVYMWNETWSRSFCIQVFFRYVMVLNCTWSINSVAHIFGSKPYDASIGSRNNKIAAILTFGEGWHNYHHTFPWDYKTTECPGTNYLINFTTIFIDFFAKIGWAYDLKQPPRKLVMSVAMKKGDGSRPKWNSVAYSNNDKIE